MFFKNLRADIELIKERDPAARTSFEVLMLYSGVRALISYRIAHWFFNKRLFYIARAISQRSRRKTGIEIHPGAKIGTGFFIDHGMGVVIGETAEIGDNCTIYQGVTLGGTGKQQGKRHPTIGNNVMIGSGAKILGPFTVGDNSKVASNAVVLDEVPPNSTAVGVPARIVIKDGVKIVKAQDLDQIHFTDPVAQELCKLQHRLDMLEKELKDKKN